MTPSLRYYENSKDVVIWSCKILSIHSSLRIRGLQDLCMAAGVSGGVDKLANLHIIINLKRSPGAQTTVDEKHILVALGPAYPHATKP